jgi:transposase
MGHLFWLSDEAWAAIEPHLPTNQPGARRVDDRRVISGIAKGVRSSDVFRPPTSRFSFSMTSVVHCRFSFS